MTNSCIASSPGPATAWETRERFCNAPLCETLFFQGFFITLFKWTIESLYYYRLVLVSPARKPALNSRGMFSEPAMHLLIRPCPFKRMSVAMIVFRPRSQHVGLDFLLASPGRTLQVVVFERMNEDLRLV